MLCSSILIAFWKRSNYWKRHQNNVAMNQSLVKGADWKRKEASLGGDGDTGVSLNFKVHALVTLLLQNLILLTKRGIKRIFSFQQKAKSTTALGVCFAAALTEAAAGTARGARPAPSLGTTLSVTQPSPRAVVCEHVHVISIHSAHLVARWVWRHQKGRRELLASCMFSVKVSITVLITVNGRRCVCIEFWVQEAKNYFHTN